jgi:uncharacterized protein YjaZ
MTIQTHILLGSRRLQPHAKDIDAAIVKALPFIEEKLPIKDIDIVVHDNPRGSVPELGIGGYTPNAHLVFISLDPSFPKIKESICIHLKHTLAHELHHTMRWRDPGYGITLVDALITEGLADCFDLEVFGGESPPWSRALSDEEFNRMIKKAQGELHNKKYDHSSWFYGNSNMGIPRWTGYSLGYKMIRDYLQKHPDKKPSLLYATKTDTFL